MNTRAKILFAGLVVAIVLPIAVEVAKLPPQPPKAQAAAAKRECPDGDMAVLKADHHIRDVLAFQGVTDIKRPGILDINAARNATRIEGECAYRVRSYVDVRNRFGGFDRVAFTATVRFVNGKVHVDDLRS